MSRRWNGRKQAREGSDRLRCMDQCKCSNRRVFASYLYEICYQNLHALAKLFFSWWRRNTQAAAAGCTAWSSSKSTTVPGAFATPRGGGSLPHSQKWSHSVVVGVQSCQLTNTPQPDDDEIEWQGAATGPALFSVPFCSIIPV
jgi:hypothetical protein